MEENKVKKILSSRVFLFISLLAFIWLVLVLAKTIYKKKQLNDEIESLKVEIEKTDKKGRDLSQMLEYFRTPNFLEKEAKEKLNLKKDGEIVVIVPEAAIGQELSLKMNALEKSQPQNAEKKERSNLVKWWEYFFKK